MRLNKSACITVLFPNARKTPENFKIAAECVKSAGFQTIEYYYDGIDSERIAPIIGGMGLSAVYVAVLPHKEQKLHLCDTDENCRQKALGLAKKCMRQASIDGAKDIMFNSGMFDENDIGGGLKALEMSFVELHGENVSNDYGLRLLIEPCDSRMDAKQLIGSYKRTKSFMERMDEIGVPLYLNMDTAHTAEEGEEFIEAVKSVKKWCSQIHYANCITDDTSNPFYGDKHIPFYYKGSVFSVETLREMTREMDKIYPGDEPLRIGLEVLCREGDPQEKFLQMAADVFGGIA